MNAGVAITKAMRIDRNIDRLAMLHLHELDNALRGYYWGWYGLDIAARHGRKAIHDWKCPMHCDASAKCICSVMAWRRPWMNRPAEDALAFRAPGD